MSITSSGRDHRDGVWADGLLEPQLRTLWDQGMSAREIALRLGVSKSAVMGKVHRLRLTPRTSPLGKPSSKPVRVRVPLPGPRGADGVLLGPTLPPLACLAGVR